MNKNKNISMQILERENSWESFKMQITVGREIGWRRFFNNEKLQINSFDREYFWNYSSINNFVKSYEIKLFLL